MTEALTVQPIRTALFRPGQNLAEFVVSSVPREQVRERMILAVTSKIVSLAEKRILPKEEAPSKTALVERESDHFLGEIGYGTTLTITHGLFIPAAGIDESNTEGEFYILFPEDPYASALRLWSDLRKAWNLRELGVLLTDSHTTPLRRGVTGIGLSFWGFAPTENLVGTKDLFGRPFKMTHINRVDALATAAVLTMGEGTAPQPLAVIHGADVRFTEEDLRADLVMPLQDDLYYPILQPLISATSNEKTRL